MFGISSETLWSPQIWLIFIATFMLAYNFFTKQSWRQLPPGPPALPLLGSVPFLGADIREPLRKMAAKYGHVFTIYLGQRRVIVLDGHDVIKEAFVKNSHAFSGRPSVFFVTEITEGYGIVSSYGPFWREQRRHALHVLRDFGFGRSILEDRIVEEVGFFIRELHNHTDSPYYPQPIIQKSVANIIASVTFGRRMDYKDPLFLRYMEIMNYNFERTGNNGALTVFPFLRYLPGDLFGLKQVKQNSDYMLDEFRRIVDEHRAADNWGNTPNDFIDAYLLKMEEEKDNPDTTFTERQLLGVIGDLFGAGTETTSTTLTWGVVYMSLYPDIQERIQAEIDEVIGVNNVPSMQQRTQMPLTEASICELQRLGDIVPLGVPHATTEDVHFRNYFIPKDTMVMPNMYGVNMDSQLWPEPHKFKPERFMDEEGKLLKREELIPFSVGKRLCLGEGLARMELFLYFTSMLQHFRFRLAPGYPEPDTLGKLSITNIPRPFHVIVEARR